MTFFSAGVGLLIYLVLWIVMPSDDWSREEPEPRRLPEP
jgi:phage shock protein PspC (stress-responsive transcriptional regulator)